MHIMYPLLGFPPFPNLPHTLRAAVVAAMDTAWAAWVMGVTVDTKVGGHQ